MAGGLASRRRAARSAGIALPTPMQRCESLRASGRPRPGLTLAGSGERMRRWSRERPWQRTRQGYALASIDGIVLRDTSMAAASCRVSRRGLEPQAQLSLGGRELSVRCHGQTPAP